jgi:hypothetical protein
MLLLFSCKSPSVFYAVIVSTPKQISIIIERACARPTAGVVVITIKCWDLSKFQGML